MDLTDALAAAERDVLAAFHRCIAVPGATTRELNDLYDQFENLRAALKAAPTDARRLEIMGSAARIFSDIAKKGFMS